ncbi:xanthine dehydrogenase family protein molybdopterin-binding subunit [Polynucleobacter rarus]|uniref:xanthine dehydrogenase family protein molybdopterin-binding subunit n=1 Tax=Polynucleobacter rarus TaxID=556055 RepID=UPI000D3E3B3F|nr:molybdopterin cofactor-binding domain-containing protein [Polynucleobacter rarus]
MTSSHDLKPQVKDLPRRKFIKNSTILTTGFALGFQIPFTTSAKDIETLEVNAWVVVEPDDTCIIRIARVEMGQGTLTGLAQLVAEELDCDWKKVKTERVSSNANLSRKNIWGDMLTVGSFGLRFSQDYVRRGGATARAVLLQAAANEWQVPVSELTVSDGIIRHSISGKTTSYGKVAQAATKLTPPDPKTIQLKNPSDWKIVGKPVKRLDTKDKLDGSKVYAVDVQLPGMLNAIYISAPVFGTKINSFDSSDAFKMAGVKKIIQINNEAFAVIADTWWHAKVASEKVKVTWDESNLGLTSDSVIHAYLQNGLTSNEGVYVFRNEGNVENDLSKAVKKVEATYSAPFLAHATMEPMNCVAKVSSDMAEIWVPTQDPQGAQLAMSKTLGLPLEQCKVNRYDPGGGFGRRGRVSDYVISAVEIAKQMPGVPIKMIWTREEDMTHGQYRPITQAKLSAALDEKNQLTSLKIRISGQSIYAWRNPSADMTGYKDDFQLQGLFGDPNSDQQLCYKAPNVKVEWAMRNTHVPVGTWRGVNVPQNSFYVEAFIEEIAKAAKADSYEFRKSLTHHPKQLATLNLAAAKAGWGTKLPKGVFRGISQFMSYGTHSAAVVELSVDKLGQVKVHRVVLVVDCGYAVNPGQIEAQVEGSIVYGLSAAMWGECTIERGRVKQKNFDTYRVLRLAEMPKVETHIHSTGNKIWGGIGEPTIAVVAPAVVNAIYAATGKPVRDLPIKNNRLV